MARTRHKACFRFGLTLAAAVAVGPAAKAQLQDHASWQQRILPTGLAVLWDVPRRRLDRGGVARSMTQYSANGSSLGLRTASGIRLLEAGSGSLLRWLPPDSIHQSTYSFAVSASGEVAIGRAGYIELRGAENQRAYYYRCADACGPVLAVTFSPDGSLLAYQGTRGLQERRKGLGYAVVLDARTGRVVTRLEAIAARALVAFSADGRQLSAANMTQIDVTEMFGLRTWDTSDWSLTRHLTGTERKWRAIGHLGRTEFAAAYEADGRLELRDLSNDALIWSEQLIGPSVEDAEPAAADAARLSLIEFAPNGRFLVSYESRPRRQVGTIVIRHAGDGRVAAMYDVAGVTDLAIAPDSRTFAYSTPDAATYTTLAYMPL